MEVDEPSLDGKETVAKTNATKVSTVLGILCLLAGSGRHYSPFMGIGPQRKGSPFNVLLNVYVPVWP